MSVGIIGVEVKTTVKQVRELYQEIPYLFGKNEWSDGHMLKSEVIGAWGISVSMYFTEYLPYVLFVNFFPVMEN